MILYGSSFSPFVRKALAFAGEKGVELKVTSIGLGSTDPAFLAASPFGKIPALKDDDFTVSDSTAIVTYFEALHPEPGLIPSQPRARARTVWYDEFADEILFGCAVKMFFNRVVSPRFLNKPGDLALADKAQAEQLPPILAYLEGVIPPSNFLVEDRLTLADLAVASPFVNLSHAGVEVDASIYPKLSAYVATILARPSFKTWVDKGKAVLSRPAN